MDRASAARESPVTTDLQSNLLRNPPGGGNAPSDKVLLLDIPFDALTFSETLDRLVEFARGDRPRFVVTANVDHVVRYHRCPEVRPLYHEADMVVADGTPLIWASRWLKTPLPERVAGSDLFPALCARAAEDDLSVFFLGGAPGAAERAAGVLQSRLPALRVTGTYCPAMGFEHDDAENKRIVERIRAAGADILFVGLGSPKQEQWISRHRTACGARLSLGIGISFSFVAGDVRRAPRWMQRIGVGRLHRLVQEPGRLWKRYILDDSMFLRLVLAAWWHGRKNVSTP